MFEFVFTSKKDTPDWNQVPCADSRDVVYHNGNSKKKGKCDVFLKMVNCFCQVISIMQFRNPLAISQSQELVTDGHVNPAVGKLLDQARDSLDKLAKESLKLLKNSEKMGDEDAKKLRQMYATSQQDLANVQHVKMFGELPNNKELTKNNFDQAVYNVAQNVEKFNKQIEICRAAIRAKNN